METMVENKKINLVIFRDNISVLEEEQKFLKNQRKTINLVGERKIDPSEAAWKCLMNKEKLRIMYAAYGFARGKTFSQIENHYPEENHPLFAFTNKIDELLSKYKLN